MRRFLAPTLLVAAFLCRAEVEEKNTTQRTFSFAGQGARKLIIDNVQGGISAKCYRGSDVQITVHERWRARSQDELQIARREVKLTMTQDGNTVKLYADGPFRSRSQGPHHDDAGRHYNVAFDFEVRVPEDAALDLWTVNGGDVRADGSNGDFDVHNVNGSIELLDMAGSGEAHTVNGKVNVTFRSNPKAATSFKTINGEIAVRFEPSLAADVRLKTFNGSAWTDFETTALPKRLETAERSNGKFVYRGSRFTSLRIGGGGPEHTFETLNGAIRILKKGNQEK
jgi:hypothetical protein